ncbi:uncharacterized protein N7484_005939 [Penicillium longicatenatum]|uniref:uncharacterized protein n=1 Tax=Penicillium longicatenatum TaxID=1561947 RepID=UPI002548AB98|nr:uncharacterized protein N7484_005939 [Penicillium longicatenatum]KAJ5643432.1 hypothetical protein N7484_005939 [Penicillium longicatenatum]
MQLSLSIATILAINSQAFGASLFGLYRIQQKFNGEDLVLTGQGNNTTPTFEAPVGKGSQIWKFKDLGGNTTQIQSESTEQYLNCGSGSCLESPTAQTFYLEDQGPYQYTFLDLAHDRKLRSTEGKGITTVDAKKKSDDDIFEVIRVEFCE